MDTVSIFQFIGSLLLVCAMILGVAAIVKKSGITKHFQRTKSASGDLAVEDVLFLDARTRCVVVRWHNDQHLLLLSANGQPQVITHRPAPRTEHQS